MAYNADHGIVPKTVGKSKEAIIEQTSVVDFKGGVQRAYVESEEISVAADPIVQYMSKGDLKKAISGWNRLDNWIPHILCLNN